MARYPLTNQDSSTVSGERRTFILGATATALSYALAHDAALGREMEAAEDNVLDAVKPEGSVVLLDPSRHPQRFNEAPVLAKLVKQGRLPPVLERIGQDPLVIAPLHEIGRYGGTLRRAFIGPGDQPNPARFCTGPDSLLYWDYKWSTVVPNIAKSFELSEDGHVLTLKLRRGMRWSDGAPFTADDILFWYTDLYLDRHIVPRATATMRIDGKDVRMVKIDKESIQYISPAPYSALIEILAGFSDLGGPSIAGRSGMGGYAPKHYLSQFHPKYVSEERANARAREEGFASWPLFLKNRNDWVLNPELPVLMPWRVVSPINQQEFTLERNPFSVWVDSAGNQLPYIDHIHHVLCSGPDAVVFKAVAGQLDFQDRHLTITRLPLLLHNRRRSNYKVNLDSAEGTDATVRINHGYTADPDIGALLRTTDFRRALSLGIDRQVIIETLMLGTGTPAAAVPTRGGRFYPGDDWARRWATYDVAKANSLLNGLDLARRDSAGYRRLRDGRRLRLQCSVVSSNFDYPAAAEIIREQWRALGVDLDVQIVETNLLTQRAMSGDLQLTILGSPCEDPFVYPDVHFPCSPLGISGTMGVEYAQWFQSDGKAGRAPPDYIRKIMELWQQGIKAEPAARQEIGRDIIRLHVDAVCSIGLVSGGFCVYGIHVAKKNLGNVPRRILNTQILRSPTNASPTTFFFRT